jgi:phosphoribosylaminoimidazole-succinocarboxamide synthase
VKRNGWNSRSSSCPTKAPVRTHDEKICFGQAAASVGRGTLERLRAVSLELYRHAAEYALSRGIIIADTNFDSTCTRRGT